MALTVDLAFALHLYTPRKAQESQWFSDRVLRRIQQVLRNDILALKILR
jgi:hypothetical protein